MGIEGRSNPGEYDSGATAKEKLLQEASQWNDAQATAALRVVKAHGELASHLDENAASAEEREDSWGSSERPRGNPRGAVGARGEVSWQRRVTELGADKMTEVCRALEASSGCR